MKQGARSGYVGLIVILLSVAILAILYVRVYFTRTVQEPTAASFQPNTASGTVPMTEYERMHADVNAANAIKDQLNAQNQETTKALNDSE